MGLKRISYFLPSFCFKSNESCVSLQQKIKFVKKLNSVKTRIMTRVLTGVQSTGTPHLGNLLGAIIPAIKMANKKDNETFFLLPTYIRLHKLKTAKH
jgi:hypothetical protein